MSKFTRTMEDCLDKMHDQHGVGKGTHGELAVFKLCEQLYQQQGGLLYHSYEYKVDPDLAGNIKKHDGKLYLENLSSTTEIDILYVTPYRIFPIEVKAYSTGRTSGKKRVVGEIVLTDDGISGCFIDNKSPVHQNEMHCRHLYSHIFKCIPDGRTEYIQPIVVFVDECKLRDNRSDWQKKYIWAVTLDTLPKLLSKLNVPGSYRLDLNAVSRNLNEACVSKEKLLPLRIK